jgi:hypothetical protein
MRRVKIERVGGEIGYDVINHARRGAWACNNGSPGKLMKFSGLKDIPPILVVLISVALLNQ